MLDWITGKKVRVSLSLSPSSLETLDAIADHTQLTRADVIEQLTEGRLALISDHAETQLKVTPEGVSRATAQPALLEPTAAPTPELASSPANATPSPLPATTTPPQALPDEVITVLHRQVTALNQQLTDLQAALLKQRQAQAAQKAEYDALSQTAGQQQQRIAELEDQIVQLSQFATIGESRLNRWRFQHYSR